MAAILRDSSAGQLARLFLGMKIAPYEDEKEGFALSQAQSKPSAAPSSTRSRDESPDDAADTDGEKDVEKEGSEKDAERDVAGAGHAAPTQQSEDPNIIGWFGPNDEDNPQNWSWQKKMFTYAQICLLTFASECLITSYALETSLIELSQFTVRLLLSLQLLEISSGSSALANKSHRCHCRCMCSDM